MKLYSCKVRLGGSVMNEVRKPAVSAAEIEILRAKHGEDAVIEIAAAGSNDLTSVEERQRLYAAYANPQKLTAEQHKKTMDMIRGLFGHDRLPLPDDLDDVVHAKDDEDAPVVPAVRPKRTKVEQPSYAD